MNETTYYNFEKTFLHGLLVMDIADPLPSFDATSSVQTALAAMQERGLPVAAVRNGGWVTGFILSDELVDGMCGDYSHSFDQAIVLSESAPITDLILALNKVPWVFITILGEVTGIVRREDLQDPPVRMWLFGMITVIEYRLLALIERRFEEESWMDHLSPARLEKARRLQEERLRINQNPRLIDCLQFSDKAHLLVRDKVLREQIGFPSRNRGEEVMKSLEKLRNDLAHAQNISLLDWETIFALVNNLERLMKVLAPQGERWKSTA
jgi:hypothetical protein